MPSPPIRVLVVEDSAPQARLIEEILGAAKGASFEALWAPSLASALEILKREPPDVVLLDLTLPDSRGLATFEAVEAHGPHLPIVVLSALGDEAVGLEAFQKGAQDYFVKDDFDLKVLPRALRYAIERKRFQQELQESREQLSTNIRDFKGAIQDLKDRMDGRRLEEAHSLFLSAVSHELKSPLSVIKAAVGVLQDDPLLLARHRELLSTIDERSDRLLALIDSALDLGRLESGKQELRRRPADARALCESVARGMSLLAARAGVRLETDLPAGLPQASLDPERIEQVLTNLLANALKFSPRGGRVVLGLRRPGPWLEFWVSDEGPGIPPEHRERIFERFWQASPPARPDAGGLGLGLAIAKEIVSRHGGRIWAETAPGGGSLLVFRIPLAERAGGGRNVLVVDDDDNLCALLDAMLSAEGHQVERRTNGRLAIQRLRERPSLDLVFIDLILPEANGIEVIRAARKHQPQAQLAVVTGFPNTKLFYDAMSYGPLTVLSKPFQREHLRDVLARLAD